MIFLNHFKILFSNESLDFCDEFVMTMNIYFHSLLWSYLPRVPTILTTCVHVHLIICLFIWSKDDRFLQ